MEFLLRPDYVATIGFMFTPSLAHLLGSYCALIRPHTFEGRSRNLTESEEGIKLFELLK